MLQEYENQIQIITVGSIVILMLWSFLSWLIKRKPQEGEECPCKDKSFSVKHDFFMDEKEKRCTTCHGRYYLWIFFLTPRQYEKWRNILGISIFILLICIVAFLQFTTPSNI